MAGKYVNTSRARNRISQDVCRIAATRKEKQTRAAGTVGDVFGHGSQRQRKPLLTQDAPMSWPSSDTRDFRNARPNAAGATTAWKTARYIAERRVAQPTRGTDSSVLNCGRFDGTEDFLRSSPNKTSSGPINDSGVRVPRTRARGQVRSSPTAGPRSFSSCLARLRSSSGRRGQSGDGAHAWNALGTYCAASLLDVYHVINR